MSLKEFAGAVVIGLVFGAPFLFEAVKGLF